MDKCYRCLNFGDCKGEKLDGIFCKYFQIETDSKKYLNAWQEIAKTKEFNESEFSLEE